jgi:hypothetical protein
MMNVNVVSAAGAAGAAGADEYVASKEPDDTGPVVTPVAETSALAGVTGANVTGTVTTEPARSTSPVANVPKLALVASATADIGAVRSVSVRPSGAVTVTANSTEPDPGAVEPSVYTPIDAEWLPLTYVYVGTEPYGARVLESTHATAELRISASLLVVSHPVRASTIELVLPSPQIAGPEWSCWACGADGP